MLSLLFSAVLCALATSVYSDASTKVKVFALPGSNVTLPCRLQHAAEKSPFADVGLRVKWTKVVPGKPDGQDVYISMGFHKKSYGRFQERVYMQEADAEDATLVLTDVQTEDAGAYHCEVINGIDDTFQEVTLEVQPDAAALAEGIDATDAPTDVDAAATALPRALGDAHGVVFPYSPGVGRYNLNYQAAEQACVDQAAVVASFDQLYEAWRSGLDWCNAGWLSDGTVQYPITKPREPCGGTNAGAGLRNYGRRDKSKSRFDVFCFTAAVTGRFYWLVQPHRLSYDEAVQACVDDGSEIAKVGHMYAAWKMQGYDRCDAGWLADGSVRYPISRPRKNCSPTEAAVRLVGFPDKQQQLYGVYCFEPAQQ